MTDSFSTLFFQKAWSSLKLYIKPFGWMAFIIALIISLPELAVGILGIPGNPILSSIEVSFGSGDYKTFLSNPVMVILIILFCVWIFFVIYLSLIVPVYNLIIPIRDEKEPKKAFAQARKLLLPVIGVGLWMFLYSHGWLIVVSILLAVAMPDTMVALLASILALAGAVLVIVRMPRVAFSPIILIKEGIGIRASVRECYKRTQGYWCKIFGNYLLFMLMMIVIGIGFGLVVGIVIGGISAVSAISMGEMLRTNAILAFVAVLLQVIVSVAITTVQQLLQAFGTAFFVHLGFSIFANPRAK